MTNDNAMNKPFARKKETIPLFVHFIIKHFHRLIIMVLTIKAMDANSMLLS